MADKHVTSINGMGAITESGGTYSTTGMEANDHMQVSEDFVNDAGIVGADDFEVSQAATPGKKVLVQGGVVYVLNSDYTALSLSEQKYWRGKMSGSEEVTITDNTSGNPRIDIICVKIDPTATPDDEATNVMTLVAVAGTPAASPSVPATPDDHYKLAEVAVANGFTSIIDANITDTRETTSLTFTNMIVYDSGSGTYTPSEEAKKILVEIVGAGGGGGGGAGTASGYCGIGGGGGGGGYCRKFYDSIGTSYSYSVGAGGTGGAAGNNNGVAGGSTTFDTMTANGGGGGNGSANGNSAEVGSIAGGGSSSGGDFNSSGRPSGEAFRISGSVGRAGSGGSSVLGSGGTARSSNDGGGNGSSGNNGGGGGGGFASSAGASRLGGDGGDGLIVIYEFAN